MSEPLPSSPARAPTSIRPNPPGAWRPAHRVAQRVLAPVERLLAIQASSGIVLFAAAAIAMLWANSRYSESYRWFWSLEFGLRLGPVAFVRELRWWVNDGLMAVFFFVVGLELRREIHNGELAELRRASLPIAAALGGTIAPALVYLAVNHGRASAVGWPIPMATDIAFALGIFTLLASRVAPAMRVVLLALAVVDDLAAVGVIAVCFSTGLHLPGLLFAALGFWAVLTMRAAGVRSPWLYVPAGVIVWAGIYAGGLHPTMAGVLLGVTTPPVAWLGREGLLEIVSQSTEDIRGLKGASASQMFPHLALLEHARIEATSPVERIQHALHRWVAFGIMPLFALANAGVVIDGIRWDGDARWVFVGVALALFVGKPLGVIAATALGRSTGLLRLPAGLGARHIALVGSVAGVGFTMALFLAQLCFGTSPLAAAGKLGVLVGSGSAALLTLALGRTLLSTALPAGAAETAEEAEQSTER
ncbi:MAG: Na+/H+ antiporter NhaA [Deltaproteobacteria bacterium]|nr:Na+/H+ antiporter NhaA [Deltaproteobacteria bacterium]